MLLSEITLKQCMHTLTPSKMELLLEVLEELKKHDFSGRFKLCEGFLKGNKITGKQGYKITGLEFPFMLNSQNQIKRLTKPEKNKKEGKKRK